MSCNYITRMDSELYINAYDNDGLYIREEHALVRKLVAPFLGIPRFVASAPAHQLSYLDLSHNKLSGVDALPRFQEVTPALIVLKLGHNALTTLSCVSGCMNLRELWVHGNRLAFLEGVADDLRQVPALRQLTIQDNPCIDDAIAAILTDGDAVGAGMDGVAEHRTAAHRRRAVAVEALSQCLGKHARDALGQLDGPSTDGTASGGNASSSVSAGIAASPVDLWLVSRLPSLQVLVTGAPPHPSLGSGSSGPVDAAAGKGSTSGAIAGTRTVNAGKSATGGRGGAAGSRRGAGGLGHAVEPTKEHAAAAASIVHVSTAMLLTARSWSADPSAGGGNAWLGLVQEAQRANAAAALAKAKAQQQQQDKDREPQAEGNDQDDAVDELGGGAAGMRRVPDLSSVKAKVPSRVVPRRHKQAVASKSAPINDDDGHSGDNEHGDDVITGDTTAGDAQGDGLAGADGALLEPGATEGHDTADGSALQHTAGRDGNQSKKRRSKSKARTTSKGLDDTVSSAVVADATGDGDTAQPEAVRKSRVPSRVVAPLKPHQKWRTDNDSTTKVAGSSEAAADGTVADGTAGGSTEGVEGGTTLGAEGLANTTGTQAEPNAKPGRKPDIVNVKPKVPSRIAPPLQPHQRWGKAEGTAGSGEGEATAANGSAQADDAGGREHTSQDEAKARRRAAKKPQQAPDGSETPQSPVHVSKPARKPDVAGAKATVPSHVVAPGAKGRGKPGDKEQGQAAEGQPAPADATGAESGAAKDGSAADDFGAAASGVAT